MDASSPLSSPPPLPPSSVSYAGADGASSPIALVAMSPPRRAFSPPRPRTPSSIPASETMPPPSGPPDAAPLADTLPEPQKQTEPATPPAAKPAATAATATATTTTRSGRRVVRTQRADAAEDRLGGGGGAGAGAGGAAAKATRSSPSASAAATAALRRQKREAARWHTEVVLASRQSPLAQCDVRALLCQPEAWTCLTAREQQEVLALFPQSGGGGGSRSGHHNNVVRDPATGAPLRPDVPSLKNDDNFRHDCARYRADLAAGFHDKVWLAEAFEAHAMRREGLFDAYVVEEFETTWGVAVPDAFKPPSLRVDGTLAAAAAEAEQTTTNGDPEPNGKGDRTEAKAGAVADGIQAEASASVEIDVVPQRKRSRQPSTTAVDGEKLERQSGGGHADGDDRSMSALRALEAEETAGAPAMKRTKHEDSREASREAGGEQHAAREGDPVGEGNGRAEEEDAQGKAALDDIEGNKAQDEGGQDGDDQDGDGRESGPTTTVTLGSPVPDEPEDRQNGPPPEDDADTVTPPPKRRGRPPKAAQTAKRAKSAAAPKTARAPAKPRAAAPRARARGRRKKATGTSGGTSDESSGSEWAGD